MHKPSSKKSIIILIVVLIIAGLVYFYYQGKSGTTTSSTTLSVSSGPDSSAVGTQVLNLLNQIRSLRIDASLFTDPGYQSLKDYSVAIPPENVGRANPFAPLPGDTTSSAGTAAGQ